jgi:hypothetical protein
MPDRERKEIESGLAYGLVELDEEPSDFGIEVVAAPGPQ